MMKKFYIFSSFILIISLIFIVSCGDDPDPGLYPTYINDDNTPPVITSVDPPVYGLAGITILTVSGQNFSPVQAENRIYFNGVGAEIISSSPTQIVVKAPVLVADTVKIKVSKFKTEYFSNEYIYRLQNSNEEYYPFDPDKVGIPWAITFDTDNNMLVSLQVLTDPLLSGIKLVTPQKELLPFIPKGTETKWDALRIFSNGDVYGSKSLRGIWKMQEPNPPTSAPWAITPSGTFLKDFDFDQSTNLWAVGNNNFIFKIKQDLSVTQYPFVAQLRAVRVYQNNLYVAGLKSGIEGIWKIPIDVNGDLGTEELYFSLTDNYPTAKTNVMTFSEDGDLYLGTNNNPDPVIVVHSNGSTELLYPGFIEASEIISLYWPQGNRLFVTRASSSDLSQTVLWIDVRKPGAAYYNQ